MGRLLHDVAQVAGELQLSGALHHIDFHFQGLAAYAGPGQARDQAHLVAARQTVRQEFADAQEVLQIAAGDGDFLWLLLGKQLHICLPANGPDFPLQVPNTGFPGIAADDLPNGVIRNAQLGLFQSVLFQLLGHQVILGNHELLFIGIGAQFDDLHTVQQGSGDGIQGVGGGDEHYIGQVEGNLNIMVPIGAVLLRIQHLQQRRAGVAPVV